MSVRITLINGEEREFVNDPLPKKGKGWGCRFYEHEVANDGSLTVVGIVHSACLGRMTWSVESWSPGSWTHAEKYDGVV